jgi:hypothetical protein
MKTVPSPAASLRPVPRNWDATLGVLLMSGGFLGLVLIPSAGARRDLMIPLFPPQLISGSMANRGSAVNPRWFR